MKSRGVLIIGIFLIGMGLVALVSNLTRVNFSSYCFPTGLILLGLLVLLRPKMVAEGTHVDFTLIGEYKRSGLWPVQRLEIWSGVGEVKLDFTQADVPTGETFIHIYHMIGDVVLRPGSEIGLTMTANGLLNTVKWMGDKQDNFLNSMSQSTDNYFQAARKVHVEVTTLIGDIKVIPSNAME